MISWLENEDQIDCRPIPRIPNQGALAGPLDSICLHYTAGGDVEGTYQWFLNVLSHASCHFLISRDGQVIQILPLNKRAFHIGRSEFVSPEGERRTWVDRWSIGIELASYGCLIEEGGEFYYERGRGAKRYKRELYGEPVEETLRLDHTELTAYWEPFKREQIDATVALCGKLCGLFKIPLKRIISHEDVAFPEGRKIDCGGAFNMVDFKMEIAAMMGYKELPSDIFEFNKAV